MRPYIAVVSARFRMLLQYRAAAAAGFGCQLFWGLIRVMIFDAFYRSSTAEQPMTFGQAVTYIWLTQALIRILPWRPDDDIAAMIRTGNVAYELLRPADLYTLWYSRAIANATAPTLLRCLPMFILAYFLFDMQLPASPGCAAAWAVAIITAVLLAAAISTLQAITLFWTISADGMAALIMTAVCIFSGMIIPLPLFPDWAQPILNFLPFRGLMDTPLQLYLGNMSLSDGIWGIGNQLAWTFGLIVFGRILLGRGLRRLVVQGG